MKLRFADKPVKMHADTIQKLDDEGDYIATQKLDGWMTNVFRDTSGELVKGFGGSTSWAQGADKSLYFISRRKLSDGGPTQISVSDEIVIAIEAMNLPDQTHIVGEWMKRRTIGECPELLYLIDILWLNDKWLGKVYHEERWIMLNDLYVENEHVVVPDVVESGFAEFFEKQQQIPYSEGLVLKSKMGFVLGNKKECKKNIDLIKIKYRDGSSGRDIV